MAASLLTRASGLASRRTIGGYGMLAMQRRAAGGIAQDTQKKSDVLQKGAKKDPELFVLLAIMSGAFGLAGWYFGRKPTSASSESNVPMAVDAMPWQTDKDGNKDFKYQYHPGGDTSKPLKEAPSALNVVIVPDVTLPKSLHDKYNKWGKDGY